jgi:hypothetical protein
MRAGPGPLALAIGTCSLLLAPSPARAHLMDAFDARTLDPGTLELEVQPVGYFAVPSEDAHYLVTPSLAAYVGIVDRVDLVLLSRGYASLDDPAAPARYHTRESMVTARLLLREGTYSTDGASGPSLALIGGALLPNAGVREHVGATLGFLFSQQWDAGTLHGNPTGSYTPWGTWDVFVPVAFEGPPEWSVRPLAEVWLDQDGDFTTVSAGAGVYVDFSDTSNLGVGARYARGEGGYDEVEIRASFWWELSSLWGDGDDSEAATAAVPRRLL